MSRQRRRLRVVKVGGSLLDWPQLPAALDHWLSGQPEAIHVLLCGGGRIVDEVRRASQDFSLSDEQAHWLAIDCLSLTAQLLATICRRPVVADFLALQDRAQSNCETLISDPRDFLKNYEASAAGPRLPHNWTATSDSIAARLAHAVQAAELVLLKSQSPPPGELPALAAAGYVDGHFPVAAAGLSVRCVNLRALGSPPA